MGRRSKLTDKQWAEIERRLIDGESRRALAREFGITETAIRKRMGSHVRAIVSVADQLLAADQSLKALPIGAQINAQNLFQRMRSISDHLASAAEYGAMTSHRLHALAHQQSGKIDEVEPGKSEDTLQTIAALTRIGNAAGETAVNLLTANRDAIKSMNAGDNASRADLLKEIATALPD